MVMTKSISEITQLWGKVLKKIEQKLNDAALFSSFFAESYVHEVRDGALVVIAPGSLAAQVLKTRYYDLFIETISEVSDTSYSLLFLSPDDPSLSTRKVEAKEEEFTYFKNAVIRPDLTFDNFVVGSFNREASEAANLIAARPGKMFNPLFIHSNSGLGKTHLMHAVGNYIKKNINPNAKVLYITANDFVEEFIRYVKGDTESQSLKAFFRGVDVLLFDDVQFLANKVKNEEMFFFIYQEMINANKQVIITSDRHPNELNGLEDRLVTRFNQGLVVKINEPDQSTCVEILRRKFEESGYNPDNVDADVYALISSKFSRDVRELEGAVNRLLFYAMTLRQVSRIDMPLAMEVISTMVGGKNVVNQVNEKKIIETVATYYNLTYEQLIGKTRTGQIAMARHIAMYLIREVLDVPFKKVGDAFGGKDHSTVISAITKVEKELKTDPKLVEAINELKSRIKN